MEHEELTRKIIGSAYAVQNELGIGFLESVYEAALAWELEQSGFQVETQFPLTVSYKGRVVGKFVADMVINGQKPL